MVLSCDQQQSLCRFILLFKLLVPNNVDKIECVREGIRNVLTGTGVRPGVSSLKEMWCCFTAAQVAFHELGGQADSVSDIFFREIDIASAAPNSGLFPLSVLKGYPWAGTLAMEIPSMLKVMDELLAAIPGLTEHAQISNVVLDCRHVLSDVLAILEGPGH